MCYSLFDDNGRFIILKAEIDKFEYILVHGPNEDTPDFVL